MNNIHGLGLQTEYCCDLKMGEDGELSLRYQVSRQVWVEVHRASNHNPRIKSYLYSIVRSLPVLTICTAFLRYGVLRPSVSIRV